LNTGEFRNPEEAAKVFYEILFSRKRIPDLSSAAHESPYTTACPLKSSDFTIHWDVEKYSSGNDLFDRTGLLYLTEQHRRFEYKAKA